MQIIEFSWTENSKIKTEIPDMVISMALGEKKSHLKE
jgi:hypothetical protein